MYKMSNPYKIFENTNNSTTKYVEEQMEKGIISEIINEEEYSDNEKKIDNPKLLEFVPLNQEINSESPSSE